MKNIIKKVILADNISNYVQMLNYEVDSCKNIMNTIMLKNKHFEYDVDIYNEHIKNFKNARAEYNILVNELIREHVPAELLDRKIYFSLNYFNNEAIFYEMLGGNSCESCS